MFKAYATQSDEPPHIKLAMSTLERTLAHAFTWASLRHDSFLILLRSQLLIAKGIAPRMVPRAKAATRFPSLFPLSALALDESTVTQLWMQGILRKADARNATLAKAQQLMEETQRQACSHPAPLASPCWWFTRGSLYLSGLAFPFLFFLPLPLPLSYLQDPDRLLYAAWLHRCKILQGEFPSVPPLPPAPVALGPGPLPPVTLRHQQRLREEHSASAKLLQMCETLKEALFRRRSLAEALCKDWQLPKECCAAEVRHSCFGQGIAQIHF